MIFDPRKWRRLAMAGVLLLTFACRQADSAAGGAAPPGPAKGSLPRLVDLGADQCIPCKMMAPILADLKKEYAGRMEVVFIDVWKNEAEAARYGVRMIPTQIFYDPSGKEILRHSGFIGKEEILKSWQKLGYEFRQP